MKTNLYATVGDQVVQIKNKRGHLEEKTVEGKIVFATVFEFDLTPESFQTNYGLAKSLHSDCVVRFCDQAKEIARG